MSIADSYNGRVSRDARSLVLLTAGCTFAAALFGFGSEVYAIKSSYEGQGKETLILLTRLLVYLVLAVTLALRGGWRGVLAAVVMSVGATLLEWALFPLAFGWAAVGDPSGYAERFGDVSRPPYAQLAVYDVLGVSIAAALAQGLRLMANVDPKGPREE